MKKKLCVIMLCSALAVLSLTACGSKENTATKTTEATGDMCSDESFAVLQEAFATLAEAKNRIADYYMNNDDIEQNDNVEEYFAKADIYLVKVGAITQESITEEDAELLANSMLEIASSLNVVASGFGLMAEVGAPKVADGEMCSDETYAKFSAMYESLKEGYNLIVDYYMKNPDVEQSDDIEDVLNKSKDYLEMMGEVTQDSITEAEAKELAESMATVADALTTLIDSM